MPFQPGQSGNPGGRPKQDNEVRDLARTYSVAAIERLAFWSQSDNATASVQASNAILDRAWGKPTQPLGNDPENPLNPPPTTEALLAMVEAAEKRKGGG